MATGSQARPLIPALRPWLRDRELPASAAFAGSMLGRTLWAHKLFLACLVLSVLALTSLHVSQMPPAFEAETLVLLGDPKGDREPARALTPTRQEGPQSEALAFRSPAMAERLVDALSLHLLPEFNPALRTEATGLRDWFDPAKLVPNSLFNSLPAALREALSVRSAVSDQQQAASLRAEVAAQVQQHIAAEAADRPGVIRVRFVSTDPRLAALGANTLADLYLADRLAARQAVSIRAQTFLRDEIARLRATIAEAALQELAAQAASPEGDASASEAAGVRQADRDLLETYSVRLREIAALSEGQDAGARVISAAAMPDEPVDPRRKLTFGVALLGALLVGSVAALGLERLDSTISSAAQLRHPGLADLGTLPPIPPARDSRRPPDRHLLDDPTGPFALAVAALRNELVRANVMARRSSLLLTAALAGEGATTTALSLVRTHARAGGRPLLIDCNLRTPRLHELVGADNARGLTSVLAGEHTLAEVAHLDERSGALLVTAGPAMADAQPLLAGEAMLRLLREAAQEHDLVILDGPPVLGGGDARLLAQMADGTVLVARWGSTRRQEAAAAAAALIEAGADMAGLVLTRARPGRTAAEP